MARRAFLLARTWGKRLAAAYPVLERPLTKVARAGLAGYRALRIDPPPPSSWLAFPRTASARAVQVRLYEQAASQRIHSREDV